MTVVVIADPEARTASGRGVWSSRFDAALAAAERGWPVFPLAPFSKIPVKKRWESIATTDRDQLEQWWSIDPDRNLLTGLTCDTPARIPLARPVLGRTPVSPNREVIVGVREDGYAEVSPAAPLGAGRRG